MGSMKEQMMEQEQEKIDIKHAKGLGITYAEFQELDLHDVDDSENNGTLTFQFNVANSPAAILKKIGADDNGRVTIQADSII